MYIEACGSCGRTAGFLRERKVWWDALKRGQGQNVGGLKSRQRHADLPCGLMVFWHPSPGAQNQDI